MSNDIGSFEVQTNVVPSLRPGQVVVPGCSDRGTRVEIARI